jgi:predicted metal-binding protein
VRRIDPPTASNIVAIAAPRPEYGTYARETIEEILETAYSGFRAAALESSRMKAKPEIVIHTGFWGCGAFGGNRVLMCLMQIVAASMAGIDAIEFHMLSGRERSSVDDAIALARELVSSGRSTAELVARVVECGFEWGESDGN